MLIRKMRQKRYLRKRRRGVLQLIVIDIKSVATTADFRAVAIARHGATRICRLSSIGDLVIAVCSGLSSAAVRLAITPPGMHSSLSLTAFTSILSSSQFVSCSFAACNALGNCHLRSRGTAISVTKSATILAFTDIKTVSQCLPVTASCLRNDSQQSPQETYV